MNGAGGALALRRATRADADFAYRLEKATMEGYALSTWGEWAADLTWQRALDHAAAGRTEVVEWAGAPVGIQRVDRTPEAITLQQLFLLPSHQRRGIGTELVGRLVAEARAAGLPLRLRVMRSNPAQALYRRLGFRDVDATREHLYLERAP